MGKNGKGKKTKQVDIMSKLLDDPRITTKQIELYNTVLKDFPNAVFDDPITILDSKINALNQYQTYLKKILETPELTEEQIKKCLSNSYVRYYKHMLNLE